MSAVEVERSQPVTLLGWGLADRLFGDISPLDKTIKIAGVNFRVVGVSEPKGSFFGNSQDNYAVIPLGAYQRLFGARQSLQLMVKPISTERMPEAMDDATVALRVKRRLKPTEADDFGIFTSDTILGIYRQVTSGIFAVLVGIVALSLLVGGRGASPLGSRHRLRRRRRDHRPRPEPRYVGIREEQPLARRDRRRWSARPDGTAQR